MSRRGHNSEWRVGQSFFFLNANADTPASARKAAGSAMPSVPVFGLLELEVVFAAAAVVVLVVEVVFEVVAAVVVSAA